MNQLSPQETLKRAVVAYSLVGCGLVIGIIGINWMTKGWRDE